MHLVLSEFYKSLGVHKSLIDKTISGTLKVVQRSKQIGAIREVSSSPRTLIMLIMNKKIKGTWKIYERNTFIYNGYQE